MNTKVKINPDQQRLPFGGHHFPERSKAGTVTIKGSSFKEVVSKLAEHRIRNGIPLGAPKEEVTQYYAKNWPWMVMVDDNPDVSDLANDDYLAWRSWVLKYWKKPSPTILHPVEASDRWKVCESCPHAKKESWTSSKESHELDKRAFLYRRAQWAPAALKFCSLHRADLGTLSFLKDSKSYSEKATKEQSPTHCWVK